MALSTEIIKYQAFPGPPSVNLKPCACPFDTLIDVYLLNNSQASLKLMNYKWCMRKEISWQATLILLDGVTTQRANIFVHFFLVVKFNDMKK